MSGEKAPETRDRLIAATTELFRRHGFNGTSISAVSKAAEAPTGSLYHFFPGGKEELTEAALVTMGAVYRELFEMFAATAETPSQAIVNLFDGAADVLVESDFIDPCPIGTIAREVASTHEPLRLAARTVFESWNQAASEMFCDAGLPADEAAALATTVIAAIEGGFVLTRTSRDAEIIRTIGRQMAQLVEITFAADRGGTRF